MKYTVSNEENLLVVTLTGDVDLKYSPDLREVLLDAVGKVGGIVVDMSGVMMIDSSGVASLLEAFQATRKRGKGFALAGVGGSVNKVLHLAKLETVFDIFEDVETARRAIA
ncbi:MAG: STAS domain-containing protein [Rhodospirillales bacterium]|nr:STAS domain-containing protein [Rhodospirillales bacterium]